MLALSGFLLALFGGVGFLLARENAKHHGGLYFWQRARLPAPDRAGTGTVLDVLELSSYVSGFRMLYYSLDVVVDIEAQGLSPWRASARCYDLNEYDRRKWLKEGSKVPVLFDSANPTRVVIDLAKLRAEEDAAKRTEREAEVTRHAALLDPNKRS
jgi:hypothetical protein